MAPTAAATAAGAAASPSAAADDRVRVIFATTPSDVAAAESLGEADSPVLEAGI
ncbi:MAG: hypothetical protein VB835_09685 [Pirellulales bacterium]